MPAPMDSLNNTPQQRSPWQNPWVIAALLAAAAGAACLLLFGVVVVNFARQISGVSPTEHRIRYGERPQHRVVITQPLLMGATEVNVVQFRKFLESSGYRPESTGFSGIDESPAAGINWNDAVVFCIWLSAQEGLDPPYQAEQWQPSPVYDPKQRSPDPYEGRVTQWSVLAGNGYHLPTEAQWEYACRAGTATQYSFGDNYKDLDKYGWYDKNSGGHAHPVATKPANPFGLHDMHGNLWEWCQDFWGQDYYERAPSHDPPGPTTDDFRVLRGGCWHHPRSVCRSAFRQGLIPYGHHTHVVGFRVIRRLDLAGTQTVDDGPPRAISPFDARQARQHQEAWAGRLGTTVKTTNSIGMTMVLIPPGEFLMGSTDDQVEAAVKAME